MKQVFVALLCVAAVLAAAASSPHQETSKHACVSTKKSGDICATATLSGPDGGITISEGKISILTLKGGDLTVWNTTSGDCTIDILAGIYCFKASFPFGQQALSLGCRGTLSLTLESDFKQVNDWKVFEFDFCPPPTPAPPTPAPPVTPAPPAVGVEHCINATISGAPGALCANVSIANETTGGIRVGGGHFEDSANKKNSFALTGGDLTFANKKNPPCSITFQGIFCFHMNYSAAPQIVQTLEDGCAGSLTMSLEKEFKIVKTWTIVNFINFCPLPTPAPPTPKQTSPPWAKPDSKKNTGAPLSTILTAAAFTLVGIFALLFFGYACLNKKRAGFDDGTPGETIGLNNPVPPAPGASSSANAV